MNEVAARCKTILENHYGAQFKGLILYGSMARGQASSASDIDMLVLLSKPFDYFRELVLQRDFASETRFLALQSSNLSLVQD